MLSCMGDRGPDSAGLAVFSEDGDPELYRYSLFCGAEVDWDDLAGRFQGVAYRCDRTLRHAVHRRGA